MTAETHLPKVYTRQEAAEALTSWGFPIVKSTLETLACRGGGPRYSRWGRTPLYAEADLREWVQGRLKPVASTSAYSTKAA